MVKRKATATQSGRVTKRPRTMTAKNIATIAKRAFMKATETKKHSFEKSEVILSTNTGVSVENPIVLPGTSGQGGRVGHKINPVGLDIRGHVSSQNQSTSTIVKVMVVRYKDMLANPVTDLLETNAGNVSVASNDISKMYRRINTDAFDVLSSKYLNLTPQTAGSNTTKMFRMWIPLKRLRQLIYEGAGATGPSYNDINIIVFGADAQNDTTLQYELSYNCTFYYKDP